MISNRYTVRFASTATRDFRRLPVQIQDRVRFAIRRLAVNPRPPGVRKLSGNNNEGDYRIRVGQYRVLYDLHDAEILVYIVRIGHRREVYRNS